MLFFWRLCRRWCIAALSTSMLSSSTPWSEQRKACCWECGCIVLWEPCSGVPRPSLVCWPAALCPKDRDVRRMGVARLGWGLLAMRSDSGARVVALGRLGAACLMFPVASGTLGRLDYALFTAAAQHAGAATATVLFEMWPLVMVLLMPAQRRFRAAVWMLAAAGVVMAVFGYSSDASGGGS